MTTSASELGPLPQSDRNAELQRASVSALNALLQPVDYLILRDERYEDYGVDASLEINLDRHPTNLRAQVQLKAIESASPNKDGSISLSVKVANLNFLLNGTCSIYILHDNGKNELWYTWAVDQRRRLDAGNRNWLKQDEVTLRFAQRLDSTALPVVRDHILRVGRFQRQVHDLLARCPKGDSLQVKIDPTTLTTTDSSIALETLTKYGLTLVSNGFADAILRLAGILDAQGSKNPKVQLACGYATFVKGRYLTTLGHLAEASQHDTSLSRSERLIVRRLRDACQYYTGMISHEKFLELQANRVREAAGAQHVDVLIEDVRRRHLAERDPLKRVQLLSKLRALVETMNNQTDADEAVKLNANLHLLYAEGSDAHMRVIHEISLLSINNRMKIGGRRERIDALRHALQELQQWRTRMETSLQKARQLNMPLLVADAYRTSLTIRVAELGTELLASKHLGLGEAPRADEFQVLISAAKEARGLYEKADNIHGQLFCRLLAADIFELMDDDKSARSVAEDVLPMAESFGLHDVIEKAREIESGLTPYGQLKKDAAKASGDPDVGMAEMTQSERKQYALTIAQSLNLPSDRLPILERDVESLQLLAQERVCYCGCLQGLQNLFHTKNRATAYASNPMYVCHCDRHGYQSLLESTDVQAQVAHFKSAFCENCPDRKPKRG